MPDIIPPVRETSVMTKPAYSRVSVVNGPERLTISIPGHGIKPLYLTVAGFSLAWLAIGWNVIWMIPTSTSFIMGIVPCCVGVCMLLGALFFMYGKEEVTIDEEKISKTYHLFSFSIERPEPALREYISRIERTATLYSRRQSHSQSFSHGDSSGMSSGMSPDMSQSAVRTVSIKPRLCVWAGARKFVVGQYLSLEVVEQAWLADELSRWIDMSVEEL